MLMSLTRRLHPAGRRLLMSAPEQPVMRKTFAALVVDEPGVLSRISGSFSSRGFNIDSLVVVRARGGARAGAALTGGAGNTRALRPAAQRPPRDPPLSAPAPVLCPLLCQGTTNLPGMSRMTIQSSGTLKKLDQLRRQMEAMVQVREVVELSSESSVLVDLALIKVDTSGKEGSRSEVVELANLFRGAVVDVSATQLLIKLADHPAKVDAFIALMEKFEIVEMGRTGVVAVSNCGAPGTISKPAVLPTQHATGAKMSDADLPPS